MRTFHGLMFFGGPNCEDDTDRLKELFNETLSVVSGIQQTFDIDSRQQGEAFVEDAIRDIAAALLGREVEFGKTLPYPPRAPNKS